MYIEAAIYITFRIAPKLKSSLPKFYGRHHNLIDSYEISVSQMNGYYSFFAHFVFYISLARPLPDFTVYMSNTTDVKKQELLILRVDLGSLPV